MKQLKKPFFITIEGGEGVGKSYFISHLSNFLKKQGFEHLLTREPGGTKIAEKLRSLFNDPVTHEEDFTPEAEFLIISAARAQHVKNAIIPAMNNNLSILCDRFVDSSFVYQSMVGGLPSDFIERVTDQCTFNLEPEITFLLDCDLELASKRMMDRSLNPTTTQAKTRYDKKSKLFHEKVRRGFLTRAEQEPGRIKIINSSLPIETMIKEAANHIKKKFDL